MQIKCLIHSIRQRFRSCTTDTLNVALWFISQYVNLYVCGRAQIMAENDPSDISGENCDIMLACIVMLSKIE